MSELKSKYSWTINASLLAAAVAIFVLCIWLGGAATSGSTAEPFVGTDSAAVAAIEASHPGYRPWFASLYTPPSSEIESGLFALQAALGAGVFGYALGALRRRSTGAGENKSAESSTR